jgi:hypothetical protein
MSIRKGPTIFLVIIILTLMAVGVYVNRGFLFRNRGRTPREEQSKIETVQSAPKLPSPGNNPHAQDPPNIESNDELKDYDPKKTLSRREYGRSNPFAPLVQARPGPKPEPDNTVKKETSGPLMQVTAIFGGQAIIKVDGANRNVSAGNTLAGMKVMSVEESKVILRKGDEDYTLTLGEEPKRVPPGEAE